MTSPVSDRVFFCQRFVEISGLKTIAGFRVAGCRMSVTNDAVIVALIHDSTFHDLDLVAKKIMEKAGLSDIWAARMSHMQPYGVGYADVPGWDVTGDEILGLVPGIGAIVTRVRGHTSRSTLSMTSPSTCTTAPIRVSCWMRLTGYGKA